MLSNREEKNTFKIEKHEAIILAYVWANNYYTVDFESAWVSSSRKLLKKQ